MLKWSLTRLSYSLCSCWSPGYVVSVLTSHSLTCSTVLVHTIGFCYLLFCCSCNVSAVLFLCGFLILSLASISGASGRKLTSETPMEELSPSYVRIEGVARCIARACRTTYVRTPCTAGPGRPSTKPRHFGAEAITRMARL